MKRKNCCLVLIPKGNLASVYPHLLVQKSTKTDMESGGYHLQSFTNAQSYLPCFAKPSPNAGWVLVSYFAKREEEIKENRFFYDLRWG